jgi:hypothetical protein
MCQFKSGEEQGCAEEGPDPLGKPVPSRATVFGAEVSRSRPLSQEASGTATFDTRPMGKELLLSIK